MERRSFFRRAKIFLLVALIMLFISSPSAAQPIYTMDVVASSYVRANGVLSLPQGVLGDDYCWEITLPFSFTFYGTAYDRAYVSTNGYLNFLALNSAYYNTALPTPALPNAAIYPFWDDLLVDGSASVRTQELGTAPNRQFVIEWRDVTFYNNRSKRFDFEIVLHESGPILLQYANIDNDIANGGREMGSSATVGVENETGEIAMQFSLNTAAIGPGAFAIRVANSAKEVAVDIKPGGCPNPLNVGSKGVLPVAILGTADFDVQTINPKTIILGGIAPRGQSLEDVATPYKPYVDRVTPSQCNTLGPDRYPDMVFKFDTQEIATALRSASDGEVIRLELRGNLLDGTQIKGEDVIVIIRKGKEK
jgi:hypothetical protein